MNTKCWSGNHFLTNEKIKQVMFIPQDQESKPVSMFDYVR